MTEQKEEVESPQHYGGADNPYETIKVLEAWRLVEDAYLFNCVKYVSRAGKKGDLLTDLKKARWYLDRKIALLEGSISPVVKTPRVTLEMLMKAMWETCSSNEAVSLATMQRLACAAAQRLGVELALPCELESEK